MCPASVSGIETRDAPVTGSYWPILSLVPSNSPRGLCKVTRPCFLPSKVLNESSALSFFKFFYSYFGRSFLPFSGYFLYSPTPGGRLCSAHFTISQVDWWSILPKGEADEVELCLWSLTHPTHEHPAIFSLF